MMAGARAMDASGLEQNRQRTGRPQVQVSPSTSRLLAPVIRYAEEEFPVTEIFSPEGR
jgi:hypothetical protein